MKLSRILISLTSLLLIITACGQNKPSSMPAITATPSPASPSPAPTSAGTLQPLSTQRSVSVNGLERTYLLHMPAGLQSGKPEPLVFVFHGLSEDAASIQDASGMDAVADANGFIVAYPNGTGPGSALSWNAGGCCGYARQNNVDEPAFVRQMIADINTLAPVDPARIYASGFSNGALLSYRLACDMSDTLAAVAPVAGVLLYDQCSPSGPVSIIDIHGLSDNVVPFGGGGNIPDLGKPFPPVEQSLNAWANFDACPLTPQTDQNGLITHMAYAPCQNNTAVELYTVKGIGHSWPSPYVVQVSQTIWDFFKAHPRQ